MGCIYIIKNKINNKVYIGQTMQSVEERYKQHLKSCRCKQHYKIYRAMNKYGVDNFYYEILERDIKEEDILSDRNNGMKVDDILKKYNISYGYYYKLIKNQTQITETQTTIL